MPGSGVSSKEVLSRLTTIAKNAYAAQLEGLPMKRPIRDALVGGFADGFRSAIAQLEKLEVLEVVDTDALTPNAKEK